MVTLLSGEAIIPPFSAAAIKLGQISRDENCQMEDVGVVIQMDPGLASDVIKVASSVGFAARRISSIDQAMMLEHSELERAEGDLVDAETTAPGGSPNESGVWEARNPSKPAASVRSSSWPWARPIRNW